MTTKRPPPASAATPDNGPHRRARGSTPWRPSLPDDRRPLEEPNGPIDPKSAEAAGQVVQHYGALIEQGRFAEAAKLWGNPSRGELRAPAPGAQLEVISKSATPAKEGAAGSIYSTVPVVFYGEDAGGSIAGADVILRRVNDVPVRPRRSAAGTSSGSTGASA